MKLAKLVIVKAKTKKECKDYFKMISANEDVEVLGVDYIKWGTEPKPKEVKW